VLSKKDLDKHLNIHNKFHQSSILHGVQLLRMLRFDTQVRYTIYCHPPPTPGQRASSAVFYLFLLYFYRSEVAMVQVT